MDPCVDPYEDPHGIPMGSLCKMSENDQNVEFENHQYFEFWDGHRWRHKSKMENPLGANLYYRCEPTPPVLQHQKVNTARESMALRQCELCAHRDARHLHPHTVHFLASED